MGVARWKSRSDVLRRAVLVAPAVLMLAGSIDCASTASIALKTPRPDPLALARQAASEVGSGCYLCLRSATETYDAAISAGGVGLEVEAAGAWALLGARERELGLRFSDAFDRARRLRAQLSAQPAKAETIDAYLAIATILPLNNDGLSQDVVEADARANRATWTREGARLQDIALDALRRRDEQHGDLVAAYLLGSIACTEYFARPIARADADVARLQATAASTGLLGFRLATCERPRETEPKKAILIRLAAEEPRFGEAHYFLGRIALAEKRLATAEREFLGAADVLPRMTAAWALLGSSRLAMEDYEGAAADLGRALELEPDQRSVLLTQAKALNYAGRFEDAIVPAARLIEMGAWFQTDANYWIAFSELQLGRLQDADEHVREAKRISQTEPNTARLSGLIAFRLDELPRAQAEFELAIAGNSNDCESHLQLGVVHGRNARWETSVQSFIRARNCYAALVESSSTKRNEIDASSLSEARKDLARARLAQRLASYRRTQGTASLGAAEGETQRGAYDAATGHLDEAAAQPDLAARVAELRARIVAMRSTRPPAERELS